MKSQLCSDDAPPIGEVADGPVGKAASEIVARVLESNSAGVGKLRAASASAKGAKQ